MYLVEFVQEHWKKLLIAVLIVIIFFQLLEFVYPSSLAESFVNQEFLGKIVPKKKRKKRKGKKCARGKKGRRCRRRRKKKLEEEQKADVPGGSECAEFVKNLRAELLAKQSGEAKKKEQDAIVAAAVKVALYDKREAEVEAEIAEIEGKIAEKQAKTKEEKEAASRKIAAAEAIKKFAADVAVAKRKQLEDITKSLNEERAKDTEKQKKLLEGSCQICECAESEN